MRSRQPATEILPEVPASATGLLAYHSVLLCRQRLASFAIPPGAGGHLSNVEAAELQKLRGKAVHVHISDCDGKVHGDLPPGRGVVDFAPYLDEIKKLDIDGAISIELEYSPEPDKIEEWVAEAYRETDKLLQAAGLRG